MREELKTMDGYTPALFECRACGEEFEDHLPELVTGFDAWPECCGQNAWLIEPGQM